MNESPQTPDELYSWLCSFINLERGLGGKAGAAEHFKLDRMKALARLGGNPERSAPVIHIAGSKGKGSVAALAASILEAGGIKTARYLSPHVSDWRERISRGTGEFFSAETYCRAGRELREIYEAFKADFRAASGPGSAAGSGEPTFFELATLLFFLCARLENCRALVVETGLGGRLDATNIVNPAVSVITVIEKEHTEYLGPTLKAIAGEKAGIIKPGRPVISAGQEPEVLAILRKTSAERGAPFYYLPEMAETADIRVHSGGADFTLRNKAPPGVSAGAGDLRLSLPVPGGFQAENAALAITALRLAGFDKTGFAEAGMDEGALRRGLSAFSLPARFERLGGDPVIIVDGAHTPVSVSRCAETFRALYGEGILLFGCAADKDPGALAAALDRGFVRRIITGTGTFRPSDPAGVFQAFRVRGIPAALAPDPAAALDAALAASRESARSGGGEGGTSALPILCCGSFYLAAEIRARVFTR